MQSEINKLLAEYQLKINNCNTKLECIADSIRKSRRADDRGAMTDLRKEQSIIDARKQAYTQASADIESLLDYVKQ